MATPDIKGILQAIGFLQSADPALVKALSDDKALEKATSLGGNPASPGEIVRNQWEEGNIHRAPNREEIKTGPSQESSGGGAEKMTKEYSHPVDQKHGIASIPEALASMLGSMNASMKAMADGMTIIAEGQTATKSLMVALLKGGIDVAPAAAVITAKADDEKDEEDEVKEVSESKAKSYIVRANALIRKAKKSEDAAEDEEGDEKKASKAKAKEYRAEAGILLGKARSAAYAAGSVELKKSIRDIAAKADIDVTEEDEDEKDKAKAKSKEDEDEKAASKAVKDDKGNMADRADPKNGNQMGAAKAESVSAEQLQKAMEGITMLSTTVKGMMDVISGKSKASETVVLDIAKASPEALASIPLKILDMEDSGVLNSNDAFAAREIFGKLELAKGGQLDMSIVKDRISKTSPVVRALFMEHSAAA